MIYTVTLNPALDYYLDLDQLKIGEVNRAQREEIIPGGKGINVSFMLKILGVRNAAFGFLAGETGNSYQILLEKTGIISSFIFCYEGATRINVKIREKTETEINGIGPNISDAELDKLYRKLDHLAAGDYVVLAGNIPATMPQTIYREILQKFESKDIHFVVDATGDCLMDVLEFHPFLIKPNDIELGQLFGVKIKSQDDAIKYAQKLKLLGARNVLVSMGKNGAVLIDEQGMIYKADAPQGKVINTVGAGDSMVAGFLAGYIKHQDYQEALWHGIAAGSGKAFAQKEVKKEEIDELYYRLSGKHMED